MRVAGGGDAHQAAEGAEGAEGAEDAEGAGGADIEAVGAAALAVPGASGLARRLSELGLADEPRVVWRRPIAEHLYADVRADGALVLYDVPPPFPPGHRVLAKESKPSPVAVVDVATGDELPLPVPYFWPFPLVRYGRFNRFDARSGYAVVYDWAGAPDAPDGHFLAAVDPRDGRIVWQSREETDVFAWMAFFWAEFPDPEVLTWTFERKWMLTNPFRARPEWTVECSRADTVGQRITVDPEQVVVAAPHREERNPDALVGLRSEDGMPVWRVDLPSIGRRYPSRKGPCFQGKTGSCVVLVELVDWPECVCGERVTSGPHPERFCENCGEPFDYWATVQVHSRATGELLFTRSWPDPYAPATDAEHILALRSDVLITREGSFVRAHSLPDGRLLWSVVPPIPPDKTWFYRRGHQPHSRWVWLRNTHDESFSLFLHAATGRTLNVPGAFHHTPDDRVVTREDGELVCWALPGGAGD